MVSGTTRDGYYFLAARAKLVRIAWFYQWPVAWLDGEDSLYWVAWLAASPQPRGHSGASSTHISVNIAWLLRFAPQPTAPELRDSEVENCGKAMCGRKVGPPSHRFARALWRGEAQSQVGKSDFLNRGRLGACRADTPSNLPFFASKTRSRPEKVEGAARA